MTDFVVARDLDRHVPGWQKRLEDARKSGSLVQFDAVWAEIKAEYLAAIANEETA